MNNEEIWGMPVQSMTAKEKRMEWIGGIIFVAILFIGCAFFLS